jgi:hypothetical protein
MGFQKQRVLNHSLQSREGAVKSFQMTDLKDQFFDSEVNEFICFFEGVGDGLFKDIDPWMKVFVWDGASA